MFRKERSRTAFVHSPSRTRLCVRAKEGLSAFPKGIGKGALCSYNADKLVWFEHFPSIEEAIAREKQLKACGRKRKVAAINAMNPEWRDLYPDVLRAAETGE